MPLYYICFSERSAATFWYTRIHCPNSPSPKISLTDHVATCIILEDQSYLARLGRLAHRNIRDLVKALPLASFPADPFIPSKGARCVTCIFKCQLPPVIIIPVPVSASFPCQLLFHNLWNSTLWVALFVSPFLSTPCGRRQSTRPLLSLYYQLGCKEVENRKYRV